MHEALYIYIHIRVCIPNTFHFMYTNTYAYSRITKSQQQYTTINIGNLIFVCDFFEFYSHLKMATSYILTYLLPGYSSLCYASAAYCCASELLMCPFKFDAIYGCTCVPVCCAGSDSCRLVVLRMLHRQNFLEPIIATFLHFSRALHKMSLC